MKRLRPSVPEPFPGFRCGTGVAYNPDCRQHHLISNLHPLRKPLHPSIQDKPQNHRAGSRRIDRLAEDAAPHCTRSHNGSVQVIRRQAVLNQVFSLYNIAVIFDSRKPVNHVRTREPFESFLPYPHRDSDTIFRFIRSQVRIHTPAKSSSEREQRPKSRSSSVQRPEQFTHNGSTVLPCTAPVENTQM